MGKRRTEFEHKDPRSMGDDDDDEDEEVIVEEEPLNQEQRDLISKRKKLVPKRKFAPGSSTSIPSDSPFAALKPFPILPTANTTSSEDSANKSVFTGFKGFSGFKPLETTTTTSSSSSISSTAKTTPLTTTTEPKPLTTSVLTNGASKSTTESTNGHSSDSTKGSKNINEIEMKFIAGLNELYDKCYGETAPKRQYRLPVDVSSTGDQSDQVEAKYASLLAELNRNCSKWISKHVEESPFVILTPVFVDYFNYLILLEKSFFPETFKQTTVLNGDGHLNGHKEHTNQPKLDLTKPPSEEKKPESSLPSLSSSTPFGLFKFGSGNSNTGGGDEPGAAKPSMPTISLSFLNSKTNEVGETKTQSNNEEPKKDTTTKSVTTPATNMFKFGSDNTPKISFGSSLATDSKPSESLFKTTTTSVEKPAEVSLPSINSSSSSLTPFSILNTEKETPKLDSTSSTSLFKPLSSIGSTPFSSSPSSFLTTPSINPAPTTTPTFSFGQQSTISTLGSSASILSGSTSSTTPSPFTNFQFGANKTPGFGSGTSIFGGASSGMFGSGSSATLGSSAAGAEAEGGDDEEYQPPKPESSDVKEEGAVFTKRIKMFYFNDKEKKFSDRGIGNLFVKPVQKEGAESSYQLIIRADNKLAQILLNVKLNKLFPVSREGPKDVSYICLPNPPIQNVDSTIPCKFLFKVKTEADADELLDKLNEYKK